MRVRVGVRLGEGEVPPVELQHLHDPSVVLAIELMVDHPRCEVVPLTPLHAEDGEAILAVLVLALLVRDRVQVRLSAQAQAGLGF